MTFEESTCHIANNGFSWNCFRDHFPFGDVSLREGNFQKLVSVILETLNTNEEKELLLDLIDSQNAIFLEQIWIQNEREDSQEERPFKVYGNLITAQLQITSNLRWQHHLSPRDARGAMLKLDKSEMLISRICNDR